MTNFSCAGESSFKNKGLQPLVKLVLMRHRKRQAEMSAFFVMSV